MVEDIIGKKIHKPLTRSSGCKKLIKDRMIKGWYARLFYCLLRFQQLARIKTVNRPKKIRKRTELTKKVTKLCNIKINAILKFDFHDCISQRTIICLK